jgi:hypothetical protein
MNALAEVLGSREALACLLVDAGIATIAVVNTN